MGKHLDPIDNLLMPFSNRVSIYFCSVGLLIFTSMPSLISQVNIKIGYTPGWGSFELINDNLNQYNLINEANLEKPFGSLNFIHGLDVGLRYRSANVSFEFSWNNMTRDRDALLYFEQNDVFESRLYKFGLNSFSFGTDTYFKRFGLGVSILSQKLNIKREIGTNQVSLVSERQYSLDFHLNYILQQGKSVEVVLRPYFRYSLNPYNISRFSEDLNNSGLDSSSDFEMYGISLLFFNGRN